MCTGQHQYGKKRTFSKTASYLGNMFIQFTSPLWEKTSLFTIWQCFFLSSLRPVLVGQRVLSTRVPLITVLSVRVECHADEKRRITGLLGRPVEHHPAFDSPQSPLVQEARPTDTLTVVCLTFMLAISSPQPQMSPGTTLMWSEHWQAHWKERNRIHRESGDRHRCTVKDVASEE